MKKRSNISLLSALFSTFGSIILLLVIGYFLINLGKPASTSDSLSPTSTPTPTPIPTTPIIDTVTSDLDYEQPYEYVAEDYTTTPVVDEYVPTAYIEPTSSPYIPEYDSFRVTFIDVGQGDCTLIQDNGQNMLIDAGPRESVGSIEAVLNQNGVSTIDALILTHNDADHIQGAINIIPDYNVQSIYMTDIERSTGTYYLLSKAIDESNASVSYPKAGVTISFGTATYEVVGPALDANTIYEENNSNSIIVRVTHGNDTFLFTGDATGEEIDDIILAGYVLSAQVLKAAHHGSAADGCNSRTLFSAVNPETVVISCGKWNDYGHPHDTVLNRIRERGCKLYRTDLQGTISCTSTGNGIIWDMESTTDYRDGDQIY